MSEQIANLELYISRTNCVMWDLNPAGERRGETEMAGARSSAVRSLHTNDSEAFCVLVACR